MSSIVLAGWPFYWSLGLPDDIQDAHLNVNFRYTMTAFLVLVFPTKTTKMEGNLHRGCISGQQVRLWGDEKDLLVLGRGGVPSVCIRNLASLLHRTTASQTVSFGDSDHVPLEWGTSGNSADVC